MRDTLQAWGVPDVYVAWENGPVYDWLDVVGIEQSLYTDGHQSGAGSVFRQLVSTLYDSSGEPVDSLVSESQTIANSGGQAGACKPKDALCRCTDKAEAQANAENRMLGDDFENLVIGLVEGLGIESEWSNGGLHLEGEGVAEAMGENRAERKESLLRDRIRACTANPLPTSPESSRRSSPS